MSRPEPIPVSVLRFAVPMDAQGLSVASSCSSRGGKKESRFEISYMPWLRHFECRYYAPSEGTPRVSMVWEGHVKSWDPMMPVALPSAVADAPEVKRTAR